MLTVAQISCEICNEFESFGAESKIERKTRELERNIENLNGRCSILKGSRICCDSRKNRYLRAQNPVFAGSCVNFQRFRAYFLIKEAFSVILGSPGRNALPEKN